MSPKKEEEVGGISPTIEGNPAAELLSLMSRLDDQAEQLGRSPSALTVWENVRPRSTPVSVFLHSAAGLVEEVGVAAQSLDAGGARSWDNYRASMLSAITTQTYLDWQTFRSNAQFDHARNVLLALLTQLGRQRWRRVMIADPEQLRSAIDEIISALSGDFDLDDEIRTRVLDHLQGAADALRTSVGATTRAFSIEMEAFAGFVLKDHVAVAKMSKAEHGKRVLGLAVAWRALRTGLGVAALAHLGLIPEAAATVEADPVMIESVSCEPPAEPPSIGPGLPELDSPAP